MSIEEMKTEILKDLFHSYANESDTAVYSIGEIVKKHNGDPQEVGQYLVRNGWVNNPMPRGTDFGCSIVLQGIMEIDPDYVPKYESKIISTLGELGGQKMSLLEVLDFPAVKLQSARHLADWFQEIGLIEVLYSAGDGSISLTMEGMDYYQKNKPSFF